MTSVARLRSTVCTLALVGLSAACAGEENENDDGPGATEGIGTIGGASSGDPTEADDDDDDDDDGPDTGGSDTGDSGGDSTGEAEDDSGADACDLEPLPANSFATDIYTPIISVRCSCHVVGAPNGLAMPDAMTAQTNLVDMMAMSELVLVTAGDRSLSYLWAKVSGGQDDIEGGGGGQMPLGDTMPCNEIDAIGAWIDGGALP